MNKLILGRVGTGKTHMLREEIRNLGNVIVVGIGYDSLLESPKHEVIKITESMNVGSLQLFKGKNPKLIIIDDRLKNVQHIVESLLLVLKNREDMSLWTVVFDGYFDPTHNIQLLQDSNHNNLNINVIQTLVTLSDIEKEVVVNILRNIAGIQAFHCDEDTTEMLANAYKVAIRSLNTGRSVNMFGDETN